MVIVGTCKEPFKHEDLICHLDEASLQLPTDLQLLKLEVVREQNEVKATKGLPAFFNGPMVAFIDYHHSNKVGWEEPLLFLRFKMTDYYTFLATAMSLNKLVPHNGSSITLRDKYLRGVDLRIPKPYFATSFCVDLAVVTKDNYLVLSKRSELAMSYKGCYAVAVLETVNPYKDRNEKGELDVFKTAQRGAQEEVGIDVNMNEIRFFSLHVDTSLYLYGLTGAIFSEQFTRDDVIARRSVGIKDKWESRELYYVDFKPEKVVKTLGEIGGINHINPSSFTSIVQALIHEHGASAVEKAFARIAPYG